MAKRKKQTQTVKRERKKADVKGKGRQKPTPEALSDQQRQALLFSYKRKLMPALETEKEAKAAVNKLFELAKKEGIPKKDIKLAIQLESDEGIEGAKSDLERINRVARWLGVGKQLDLFGEKETLAEHHYEDGRRAALNDLPATPPSHLAGKDAQTWLEGHAAGRTALNTERAQGFKPLSETVTDLMDKAGVAGAIASGAAPVEPEAGAVTH